MDTFTATLIAEGEQEPENEKEYLEAWQHLLNTGICWQLQGWFGRTVQTLLDNGLIQDNRSKL